MLVRSIFVALLMVSAARLGTSLPQEPYAPSAQLAVLLATRDRLGDVPLYQVGPMFTEPTESRFTVRSGGRLLRQQYWQQDGYGARRMTVISYSALASTRCLSVHQDCYELRDFTVSEMSIQTLVL